MLALAGKGMGMGCFLLATLLLTRQFNDSGAALYSQIILSCAVTTILLAFTLFLTNRKDFFSFVNEVKIVACFFLCYSLLSSTVLNIDRSRSFYVISWVNSELISIKKGFIDLSAVRSPEKLNQEAIEDRIEEQEARGNIKFLEGKYILSNRGKLLYQFSNHCAALFKLHGWQTNRS